MKAAVITPRVKDSMRVTDVPEPVPADDEVKVGVLECGICGTDEALYKGLIGRAPEGSDQLIIGHENLGVIKEKGKRVESIWDSDLVVATVRRSCPELCFECRNSHQDMCLTGDYFERGINGMNGYMTEYYVEKPYNLIRIPRELRKVAVLMEPLSVVEKGIIEAFKIQERLPWEPERALVCGTGPIGMLSAFVLRDLGLDTYAFATRPPGSVKARVAEASGAHYIDVKQEPMEKIVSEHGPFDVIVEATGISKIAFDAMRLVRKDGIVCLTGLSPRKQVEPICTDCTVMDLVMNDKAVFGTVSSNHLHYERALKRMQSIEKKWPGLLEQMFTRRVGLDHIIEGIHRSKDDIKVVVEIAAVAAEG